MNNGRAALAEVNDLDLLDSAITEIEEADDLPEFDELVEQINSAANTLESGLVIDHWLSQYRAATGKKNAPTGFWDLLESETAISQSALKQRAQKARTSEDDYLKRLRAALPSWGDTTITVLDAIALYRASLDADDHDAEHTELQQIPGANTKPLSDKVTAALSKAKDVAAHLDDAEVRSLDPITFDQAEDLDKRLRGEARTVAESMERFKTLIAEAKARDLHQLLGFASWTAYIADIIGKEMGRLHADDRREIVALLTGEGMSQRAIAEAVGVSNATVSRDQVLQGVTPDTVTGLDGKEYARPVGPVVAGTMSAGDLHRLLHNALLFAGRDDTLPPLTVVRWSSGRRQVISVATDRCVLGVTRADYDGQPMVLQLVRADAEKLASHAKNRHRRLESAERCRSASPRRGHRSPSARVSPSTWGCTATSSPGGVSLSGAVPNAARTRGR